MGVTVLDASVLIGLLDPRDALHLRASAGFREHARDDVVVPSSAYSETIVDPARHGAARLDAVERFLDSFPIRVLPVDREIGRRAAQLRARHRLGLPDALVLASGDVIDADVVLTADARWAKLSPRVVVV
jgi:predicted nucleic acid-binding protein